MNWQDSYRPGMALWRYTFVDEDGKVLYQFESYIRRTFDELENLYPGSDDILMELVQPD